MNARRADRGRIRRPAALLAVAGALLVAGCEGYPTEDAARVDAAAKVIQKLRALGVQAGIVLGGGNIFRGLSGAKNGVNRVVGDSMGMLATIINGLAMMNALETIGVPTRVMTAIEMPKLAEPFIQRKAIRHFEKGRVVIFGAGTGIPFFSTDTVAAQRALEIGANVLLMSKNGTDGVYDSDPRTNPDARRYDDLSYTDFLAQDLKVADATAVSLARDNGLPMVFFDLGVRGNIARVVNGEKIGTTVHA